MKTPIAGVLVTLWVLLIITLSFGDGMADSSLRLNSRSIDPKATVGNGYGRLVGTVIGFPTTTEPLSQSAGGQALFNPVPVSAGAAESEDVEIGTGRLRVQEPATLVFLGIGFLVLAGYGRRLTHRKRK